MRRKVLLADDSLSIQKMFGLYLEKCEIDVVALSNGETAVSKLPAIQPDLILADVFMPGRTGYEVCEYVKQHPDFKHIPVLLLTGKFEPYDEKEAKRVKADGHIVKPIAEQEFVALIRKMLERAAPKPASPPTTAPSVAQTQVLGSFAPPPVTPVAKEPSALGNQPPSFHFVGLDPKADVPPPTIKVTPSMIDDGRLPDLEPLLPLDPAPSPPPSQDTGDFILDLPPPEQAPPVLTYPEPPKTLSTPIARPTFPPMPPPDFGVTTTKLDPAELPELLAAAPTPVTTSSALETESPLELDEAPTFAPSSTPDVLVTPATEVQTEILTQEVSAVVSSEPAETPVSAAAAPLEEAPVFIVDAGTSESSPVAAEVSAPTFVVTPPAQVTPPWTSPLDQPPLATALETKDETTSLPPATTSLTTVQTSDLLSEPIPPPDFLVGMVSPPTAAEPPAAEVAPAPSPHDAAPAGAPVMEPVTELAAPPSPPAFEIAVQEESSIADTDLLPDELLAIRKQQQAEARVEPAVESAPTPAAEAPSLVFEVAETPTETASVAAMEVAETSAPSLETSVEPALPPPTPVVEAPSFTSAVDTPQAETAVAAAMEAGEADVSAVAPKPVMAVTTPTTLQESASTPAFAPTFTPAALEIAPFAPASPVDSPSVEAVEATPAAVSPIGPMTLVDESVRFADGPATLVDESISVTEVSAAVAPTPSVLPAHVEEPLAAETAQLATTEALPVAPVEAMPPAAVDWSSFTLPPAVVDDIVRRVVAEISDRVVREIAWEVVPDLAELLIKKHLAQGNGQRTDA
ncbi:MAG: response regulator [Chloracidobacterium sp.]|nr:response regulator [Chloracidobacterium sp.]MDW8216116.1 response regulator [Acidobacteriota bacterium]